MKKAFSPIVFIGVIATLAIGIFIFLFTQNRIPGFSPKQDSSANNSPQPTPDLTGDWETYQNAELGISFKLPAGVNIDAKNIALASTTSSPGLEISPPYQAPYDNWWVFNLSVQDNAQFLNENSIIDAYIEQIKNTCTSTACNIPQKIKETSRQYINGNINGLLFHTGAETDSVIVIFTTNDNIYTFRMSGDQNIITNYGLVIFDQILSTFEIIN